MSTRHNKAVSDWCSSIWHPEMILISESPLKLQGFLIISHSDKRNACCPRVKVKLIVPNYPSLVDTQIFFGKQIALLRNTDFNKKVKNLIASSITVQSFLTQLQLLIDKYMHNINKKTETTDSISDLLQDIKVALQNQSDVRVSCNGSLNVITLFLRDISLTLQKSNDTETPWKVISSDLPKTFMLERFEKNIKNLNVAIIKFKWQVELLEDTWKQLKEIDENCWVLDPVEPNKSHMYRRIHLSQSISMTITLDPLRPTALPIIQFSGSDSEVKKQTDHVSNNILNWDPNCSVLKNLRVLLNTNEFPEQQKSLENDNTIDNNQECGICFVAKLDTDQLPDKICDNVKCMKHYHSTCLSKWLQTEPENQTAFGHIYGTCPYCKKTISCCLQ